MYLPNWIIWLTEHLSQDMLHILMLFYLVWNLLETIYIYMVLAAQGLTLTVRGPSLYARFHRRQILKYKNGPRAV